MRTCAEVQRVISLGEAFFSGVLATIYYLNEEDIQQSWQVFHQLTNRHIQELAEFFHVSPAVFFPISDLVPYSKPTWKLISKLRENVK